MEKIYMQSFAVTGVANSEVLDNGLNCPVNEKRVCTRVFVNVEKYAGNLVRIKLEREQIVEIYDYLLDTFAVAAADTPYPSTSKIAVLNIGHEIPSGQTLKIGISCGATDTDLYGAYEYQIVP